MRDRFLVVIGCQREKLDQIGRGNKRKLLDYVQSSSHTYTGVISILRKKMEGDDNFRRARDLVATDTVDYLEYQSDNVLLVPGYDVDVTVFRKDAHYDIVGISTAASVMCTALSMYSQGLEISILKDYCFDRKGLDKEAHKIFKTYMPGVLV